MPERSALAAVALGANLPSRFGTPADNVREALHRLGDLGAVVRASAMYETEPVGYRDQPRFVNAAALVETIVDPLDFLRGLLRIEREMGRDRTTAPPKGPRVIDLDLLLYDDLVLRDPELTLPHPAMQERRFVLEPLAEIAGGMMHPELKQTVAAMLAALEKNSSQPARA